MTTPNLDIQTALNARYTDAPEAIDQNETLRGMLSRGSCRSFLDTDVPVPLLDLLCATALAAPTKSDLQQHDIIMLRSAAQRERLAALVPGQTWVADAPMIAVFCGNNRRQRMMHEMHGIPFENDHLDAFFNAATDAAIALGAFVVAAEAVGLGCCPISAVRNEAEAVSSLLDLPDHVFPFAGLAIGFPKTPPVIAKRLPLKVTCHTDTYKEDNVKDAIAIYDADRSRIQPYATQRAPEVHGTSTSYGWSEDKARQYNQPERANFGAYVRSRGFRLE